MASHTTTLRYAEAAHAKLQRPSRRSSSGYDHDGHSHINVGERERQFSLIAGTALAVFGLMRGTFGGLALAAIGGALIWRGHTGHCETYHMLGYSSASHSEREEACMSQGELRPPSQEL